MDKRLLEILCCPTTKAPLRLLSETELAALNQAIGTNGVRFGNGTEVSAAVKAGLITRDRRTIYRIEDDIPVMLADEAIAIDQLGAFPDR